MAVGICAQGVTQYNCSLAGDDDAVMTIGQSDHRRNVSANVSSPVAPRVAARASTHLHVHTIDKLMDQLDAGRFH